MKFASSLLIAASAAFLAAVVRAQIPATVDAPAIRPVVMQVIVPPLAKIADTSLWRLQNRSATLIDGNGRAEVRLDAKTSDGMAWLVGSDFSEGTISADVRGANKPGQSFVGLALHGEDETTYDVIYFRPFNFKNPEPIRRARAVQYVSLPNFPWEKLRAENPGKYEAAVSPVPDPDGWFHARIVVEKHTISVFVNDATEPSLVVTKLSDRRAGLLGLWVGDGSAGDFANLEITPRNK